jgi:hypothetical protein
MPNFRICPYNHHDFATLTTSVATASGFFVTDTQNYNRSKVWRAGSTADQYIRGTMPATGNTANMLAIFLHNCAGSSVRLRLYSDAAWTTQVYDSTVVPFNNVTADSTYDWGVTNTDPLRSRAPYWLYFTEIGFRSYEIAFSTNVNGAWQVGRIWLGKYYESIKNPIFGAALGLTTNSDFGRTRGGSARASAGASWRTFNGEFDAMSESERAVWMDIMGYCGKNKDVVVSLFPTDGTRMERDYTMDGLMMGLDSIGRQVSYLTKRFQFEEV